MSFPLITLVLIDILHINPLNSAGFDYPPQMPSPHEIIVFNNVLYGYVTNQNKLETPIVIRLAHIGTVGAWNCVAQYDADALDANTGTRPIVDELPSDTSVLNSNTRSLCLQHVYVKLFNKIWPPMVPYFVGIFTLWGLDNINPEINETVIACNHDKQCLTQLARDNEFYPSFMADIIASETLEFYENDGWNADGELNSNGVCTANCKPYIDTTGYEPKIPKKNDKDALKGKTCESNDDWQALLETDGYGFFFKHEHVTPHIGITGKPFLFTEYNEAVEPKYDYDLESELLLERLKLLAVNDTMKVMVEFFDNKLLVRGMIGLALIRQYPDRLTFENFVNYIIGISTTEHDTLLAAWNQKVKYDLIRPTTVIQRRGNEMIETYGGPYQGVKKFEAKDFEPYIRVMPHSEYPSGSACLCIGYTEFVHSFVKEEFGDDELYNLTWYRNAGSSAVEYGATPKEEMLLNISNMAELYEVCSQSRLWGGMHFTTSIHSAKDICTGIGTKGYQYAVKLKGDKEFLGTTVPNDAGVDIEELWLPFLKALDFLVYHFSFGNLITGNINFDPDILKLLVLLFPDIGDLSDIGENIFMLLDDIINYFERMIPINSQTQTTEAPVIPTLLTPKKEENVPIIKGMVHDAVNNIDGYNNNLYGRHNMEGIDIMVIFIVVAVSILFLGIGLCIGIRFRSENYRKVEWKTEQEL